LFLTIKKYFLPQKLLRLSCKNKERKTEEDFTGGPRYRLVFISNFAIRG